MVEFQLEVRAGPTSWSEKGKVRHCMKNSWRRWNQGYSPQPAIGQMQPLLFFRAIKWEGKSRSLPVPLLRDFLALLSGGDDTDGKRRQQAPRIVQNNATEDGPSGEDMLWQVNIEFEVAQHQGGDISRHDDRGQHCRHDDIKQIVAGVQSCNADHQRQQHIYNAGARDIVIERLAQALDGYTARQVGYGHESDQRGENKGNGRQDDRRPEIAGIAGHRGKQG